MPFDGKFAELYTDGSCDTLHRAGAWAAILLIGSDKKILTGTALNTTHQRMELTAVIEGLKFFKVHFTSIESVRICTDSQYVAGLPGRKAKLEALAFLTKKGNELQNADLVKELLDLFELFSIELIKIKAHQRNAGLNREADMLSRRLVREACHGQDDAGMR